MEKPYWTHKKYKTKFKGKYKRYNFMNETLRFNQRFLVLKNGERTFSFESWQQAAKQGWRLEK
jgi:hypothetical protein